MRSTRLELAGIVETTDRLEARVGERFGGRGIHRVAADLATLAAGTGDRLVHLARPRWWARLVVGGFVLAAAVIVLVAATVADDTSVDGLDEWLSVSESAVQDLVFVGAAGVFLFGVEGRLRRRDALADLHRLRSLAHVVDMHQLTKDPETLGAGYHPTPSSPERAMGPAEMARYLDYCSEMLSLTSKLAALYSQDSRDPVVLGAVREIQELALGLSAKIWQKLTILEES